MFGLLNQTPLTNTVKNVKKSVFYTSFSGNAISFNIKTISKSKNENST